MKNALIFGGFLIALLISLSGCLTPSVKTYSTSGKSLTTSNGPTYESTPEVPLKDPMAVKANEIVKPILKTVFGDAKVTSVYKNYEGILLVYTLPRKVTQEDYSKLIDEVNKNGYNVTLQNVNDKSFGFTIVANDTGILFGGKFDDNRISVTTFPLSNPE